MVGVQRCDCGARVPDEDGPVHAYLAARPACWRRYGELSTRLTGDVGLLHVDCYAAQHPAGAEVDRRQRNSVAVHLVALCLLLEHGVPAEQITTVRGRTSATVLPGLGVSDWPLLDPPVDRGEITAPALHDLSEADLAAAGARWPESVWTAWSAHHGTVSGWARLLLDTPNRRRRR